MKFISQQVSLSLSLSLSVSKVAKPIFHSFSLPSFRGSSSTCWFSLLLRCRFSCCLLDLVHIQRVLSASSRLCLVQPTLLVHTFYGIFHRLRVTIHSPHHAAEPPLSLNTCPLSVLSAFSLNFSSEEKIFQRSTEASGFPDWTSSIFLRLISFENVTSKLHSVAAFQQTKAVPTSIVNFWFSIEHLAKLQARGNDWRSYT